VTWRRRSLAVAVLAILAASFGLVTPASAAVSQASLLGGLDKDRALIASWSAQVSGFNNLGTARTPLQSDLSALANGVAALRTQSSGSLTPAALSADFSSYLSLHRTVSVFEGPKVHFASMANYERGLFNQDVGKAAAIGSFDLRSPTYQPTASIRTHLRSADSELSQAVATLAGALASAYPGDSSSVGLAQLLLNQAATNLRAVERALVQLPVTGAAKVQVQLKLWILTVRGELSRLAGDVANSPDLTIAEKQNLMTQIQADIAAFNELYLFLAQGGHGRAVIAELAKLLAQPGVFILIFPKADSMLAAGADRSAIAALNSLLVTLESRVAVLAAGGANVTSLDSTLSDLESRLKTASADIAPVDSELEPMVAITSSQRSRDDAVLNAAMAALQDAASSLAAARADANRLMTATA
jgi:hypothetical protein